MIANGEAAANEGVPLRGCIPEVVITARKLERKVSIAISGRRRTRGRWRVMMAAEWMMDDCSLAGAFGLR